MQEKYDNVLKPELDHSREKLLDMNIETVVGALAIQINVPSIIAQAAPLFGIDVNPIVSLGASTVLALMPVLRDRHKAQQALKSSPVAYLMRLE